MEKLPKSRSFIHLMHYKWTPLRIISLITNYYLWQCPTIVWPNFNFAYLFKIKLSQKCIFTGHVWHHMGAVLSLVLMRQIYLVLHRHAQWAKACEQVTFCVSFPFFGNINAVYMCYASQSNCKIWFKMNSEKFYQH